MRSEENGTMAQNPRPKTDGIIIGQIPASTSLIPELIDFMGDYSDSPDEFKEALDNAGDRGFVLEARSCGKRVGIAIVLRVPFETLFPKYHMSHLGVAEGARGLGIGSALVKEALGRTKMNMSLHVEAKNAAAISLYENAGMKLKYLRMTTQ